MPCAGHARGGNHCNRGQANFLRQAQRYVNVIHYIHPKFHQCFRIPACSNYPLFLFGVSNSLLLSACSSHIEEQHDLVHASGASFHVFKTETILLKVVPAEINERIAPSFSADSVSFSFLRIRSMCTLDENVPSCCIHLFLEFICSDGIQGLAFNAVTEHVQKMFSCHKWWTSLSVCEYLARRSHKKPAMLPRSLGSQSSCVLLTPLEVWVRDSPTTWMRCASLWMSPFLILLRYLSTLSMVQSMVKYVCNHRNIVLASLLCLGPGVDICQIYAIHLHNHVTLCSINSQTRLLTTCCLQTFTKSHHLGQSTVMWLQVLVERSLRGWKEVEYEVVRDAYGNCITVSFC